MKHFANWLHGLCVGIYAGLEIGALILGVEPDIRSCFNKVRLSVLIMLIPFHLTRLLLPRNRSGKSEPPNS